MKHKILITVCIIILLFMSSFFIINNCIHNNVQYTIIEKEYNKVEKKHQNIKYPQIENLKDMNLQKEINNLIQNFLEVNFAIEEEMSQEGRYEIKRQDDKILSIVFWVEYSPATMTSTKPYTLCKAITMDIKEGKELSLYEVCDSKIVENSFLNDSLIKVEGVNDVEELPLTYLLESYEKNNSAHKYDFYCREDIVGFIIPVGPSGGGYAIFEINEN